MIVGLVGVGTMGSRMASRLLDAGHALCLHDVRPEALEPFVRAARSPPARRARSPTGPRSCSPASRGPRRSPTRSSAPTASSRGKTVRTTIDLSTIGVDAAREIHAAAAARGLRALDAPVSGGPRGAEAGTLCIMAAGSREAFDEHRDLLEVLGSELVFLGPDPARARR